MGVIRDAIQAYLDNKNIAVNSNAAYKTFADSYYEMFLKLMDLADLVEGGSTTGLAVANIVVGEVPSGLVNGSNATYTTAFNFYPDTVDVCINGLSQKKPTHFNTSGTNTIIFADSPTVGEVITVNYIKT